MRSEVETHMYVGVCSGALKKEKEKQLIAAA